MKTPTKFVQPLTEAQRERLKEVMKSQAPQRTRMRAHAILLSERRYSIDQIADISQSDRDRVSEWLDGWEKYQVDGWEEDPRSGRPPKLTEKEQKRAVKLTLKEPRSLRQGLTAIATMVGKLIRRDTLKRSLPGEDYGWKRLRRSLRSLRDEVECRAAHAELAVLRAQALDPARQCDLWYCDEAGVTLTPGVPYAWQKVGQPLALASTHSPRQNLLGFFNLPQEWHPVACAGAIDTQTVIPCFTLFRHQLQRPAMGVVDNAPIHTSDAFVEQLLPWQEQGLEVKFIPPSCPELNLIEILWRKIKYEWLPLDAYQSFKTMTRALFEVLRGIGSKYRITFA
jgi:transposase